MDAPTLHRWDICWVAIAAAFCGSLDRHGTLSSSYLALPAVLCIWAAALFRRSGWRLRVAVRDSAHLTALALVVYTLSHLAASAGVNNG